MQATHLYRRPKTNRRGLLLLVVLIGIAIAAILYAIQFSTLSKSLIPPRCADPNALPWEEHGLLRKQTVLGDGLGDRRITYDEQPKITEPIGYKAKVYQQGNPCGEIHFAIFPNGTVNGSWSADYKTRSPGAHYITKADKTSRYASNSFRGNIAPSKIYKDEHGEDPSKLYFITEGSFLLYERRSDSRIRGHIYVTGWIDSEFNASGKLTLGSISEGVFQIFEWEAKPPAR